MRFVKLPSTSRCPRSPLVSHCNSHRISHTWTSIFWRAVQLLCHKQDTAELEAQYSKGKRVDRGTE